MSLDQAILDAVWTLPHEKQVELLNYARRLREETQKGTARRSAKGLWADLGIRLSAEEIDTNKREMWKHSAGKDA